MNLLTTPERNRSRRISIDELNSSEEHINISDHQKRDILSTPSPPSNRHSQTRPNPSFLATPVQTRLFHPDDKDSTDENHSYKIESMLSPPYTHQHNNNNNNSNNNNDDGYSYTLSPVHKSRLLPPTTPKTRNTEMFLSPSPKLKSPNGYNSSITKDTKPIREISNDLKTRLNYAFVKLQNGWIDKTLPELEETLDQKNRYASTSTTTKLVRSPDKFKSPIKNKTSKTSLNNNVNNITSSSYVNQFAYGNGDSFISINQYRNKFNVSKDKSMEDSTTSAQLAFLQALASPRKEPQKVETPKNMSPVKLDTSNNNNQHGFNQLKTPKLDKYDKPSKSEVEVVETLMSLSSPQKPNASKDNNNNNENDNTDSDDTSIEDESKGD